MKKIIFSIICGALYSGVAMAQIPNNGFENWTTVGSYVNPDGWGTMNNTTAIASVYTATKGTPGSPGTAYLKLTSKTVSTTVVNGIAVSGVLDSITMMPKSGFAYNIRSANFTGKWQHMIYGSSQGSIGVTLTRWDTGLNQRVTVATANQTLSGMAMSWANFTIPFTYTDGNNPDTCIIVLKASGSAPTNNDYLWVDNLAFSGTVTGIEKYDSFLSNMNVYPNPSTESLTLNLNLKSSQQITIEITDLTGKLISSKNVGTLQGESIQTINVSGIAKGTYLVRVIGEQATEIRKVIIE
ncbi:MAG: T9SS type A sorting domain-containing protein [Bacteroidota bacterium]|nr:T9SS type A sorting domain-containing protein [Bacteroidota bacterium]MDP3147340.1 T9SS type A sorting domain-containing protein [Bacteroidota bacterium]